MMMARSRFSYLHSDPGVCEWLRSSRFCSERKEVSTSPLVRMERETSGGCLRVAQSKTRLPMTNCGGTREGCSMLGWGQQGSLSFCPFPWSQSLDSFVAAGAKHDPIESRQQVSRALPGGQQRWFACSQLSRH